MSFEGAGAGSAGGRGKGPAGALGIRARYMLLFLGLPSQVFVVLLLEALNSYNSASALCSTTTL